MTSNALAHPTACPCCGQHAVPTLEVIIQRHGVSTFQAKILEVIWNGKGRPVSTQRIFDAMYADDPDGGPSVQKMYEAFKLGLHRLRERLEGSGVAIESAGYRCGYRIKFEAQS